MARVGLGTAVFTGYNENIAGKVIKQLKVRMVFINHLFIMTNQ